GDDDHGAGPRHQPPGIQALLRPALEIAHLAGSSLGEPRGEERLTRERCQRSAPDHRKPETARFRRDPLLPRRHPGFALAHATNPRGAWATESNSWHRGNNSRRSPSPTADGTGLGGETFRTVAGPTVRLVGLARVCSARPEPWCSSS